MQQYLTIKNRARILVDIIDGTPHLHNIPLNLDGLEYTLEEYTSPNILEGRIGMLERKIQLLEKNLEEGFSREQLDNLLKETSKKYTTHNFEYVSSILVLYSEFLRKGLNEDPQILTIKDKLENEGTPKHLFGNLIFFEYLTQQTY